MKTLADIFPRAHASAQKLCFTGIISLLENHPDTNERRFDTLMGEKLFLSQVESGEKAFLPEHERRAKTLIAGPAPFEDDDILYTAATPLTALYLVTVPAKNETAFLKIIEKIGCTADEITI